MLGWHIFAFSMEMLARNLGAAFKTTLIPVLIRLVALIATFLFLGLPIMLVVDEQAMELFVRERGSTAIVTSIAIFFLIVFPINIWVKAYPLCSGKTTC
jgi:hypothetical protein